MINSSHTNHTASAHSVCRNPCWPSSTISPRSARRFFLEYTTKFLSTCNTDSAWVAITTHMAGVYCGASCCRNIYVCQHWKNVRYGLRDCAIEQRSMPTCVKIQRFWNFELTTAKSARLSSRYKFPRTYRYWQQCHRTLHRR